jgi:hypothetical protein
MLPEKGSSGCGEDVEWRILRFAQDDGKNNRNKKQRQDSNTVLRGGVDYVSGGVAALHKEAGEGLQGAGGVAG